MKSRARFAARSLLAAVTTAWAASVLAAPGIDVPSDLPVSKPRGSPPVSLERVQPVYPVIARKQFISGRVVAHAFIDSGGKVTRVRIRSSPHELLSDAVEAALLKWKFKPSMKDGEPIASVAEYEFRFDLSDPDGSEPLKGFVPAPDADTVARYIAALDGSEEFRLKYWHAGGHKAFASADEGSWAWVADMSSTEQATSLAQERCDRNRREMTRTCRIVDVDGVWQKSSERTATPIGRLSPFELTAYPRAEVDKWSAEKKARAVPVLDQCRAEADRYLQVWKTQDADAIYAASSADLREQYTRAAFDQALALMRSAYGVLLQSSFQDQDLVTRWGDDELRLDLHSMVRYSVTTTAWKGTGLTLWITLSPEAGLCRVTSLQYLAPIAMQARDPERGT